MREADEAYLSGAKKLDLDDLDAAEREFNRALRLDPTNRRYAIAISVVHQHRVTELVQQSTQARLAGMRRRGRLLLEQARALDPQNPMVLEHSQLISVAGATQPSRRDCCGSATSALAYRHVKDRRPDSPSAHHGP